MTAYIFLSGDLMKKKKRVNKINRIEPDKNIGLTDEEVNLRIENGYSNHSSKSHEKSYGKIIVHNVFNLFNTILLIIAIVFFIFIMFLYLTGNNEVINKHFGFSKFGFLIPAIMNIVIGTIQEIHGKRVLDRLKIVSALKAKVLRNGKEIMIESEEIVIDDIVILKAGEQATADFKVLEGEVSVDESCLTGESDYIKKLPGDTIYSGSNIIVGDAKVITVEVGDNTFASNLTEKVKNTEKAKSELLSNIMKIMKILTVILGIISIVIIATLSYKIINHGSEIETWDGMELSMTDPVTWARIMITLGSFAVGVIPSGLVLTTSVTLALSIVSLSRKNTLVQELYSLENLSRVDVICLDKTGTLTDGTMKVSDVKRYAHLEDIYDNIRNLLGSFKSKNQTAEALYNKFGANEDVKYKELIPFSSETKCSGLIYENGDKLLLGAPEYMLENNDERLKTVDDYAKEGKRVLAFTLNDKLLAFFIIEDTIRESAKDTLKFFKENGVTVKIISGDNPLTVSKIAEKCGVENYDKMISLEGMDINDVKKIATEYTIFARVSPEQKEAIVEALQKKRHKVAMTGDGVNDILALRKADSSITFAKATDAAKSVSDVVLMDNDFTHLKDVVGQGRRVISNIQRTSILFLMKSFAIALLAFALIPLRKGQMWYTIENAYMLEAAVIGTGGFILSLEGSKVPIKGSFIKTIISKAIASASIVAIAVILPVLLYVVPKFYGYSPIISEENVKTMISILLLIAGLVVACTMCYPFTKYRIFAIILILLTAFALSMMLPTSYIGGRATGPEMFGYDTSLGQTFLDCQFAKEFLRPWNSQTLIDLRKDNINFIIMGIFFVAALPTFCLIMYFINHGILKNDEYYEDRLMFKKRAKKKK